MLKIISSRTVLNNLRLYKIDINYIKYLYSFDDRVQYNPNREDEYSANRPYLGVILKIGKYDYFVPLEHPRKSHKTMKNNVFIFKIHNGKYGILGFNNMIPVKKEQLVEFDINKQIAGYKQILISQYHFCNKHSKEIEEKAKETYNKSERNHFMRKICRDFRLLERKCEEYKIM